MFSFWYLNNSLVRLVLVIFQDRNVIFWDEL